MDHPKEPLCLVGSCRQSTSAKVTTWMCDCEHAFWQQGETTKKSIQQMVNWWWFSDGGQSHKKKRPFSRVFIIILSHKDQLSCGFKDGEGVSAQFSSNYLGKFSKNSKAWIVRKFFGEFFDPIIHHLRWPTGGKSSLLFAKRNMSSAKIVVGRRSFPFEMAAVLKDIVGFRGVTTIISKSSTGSRRAFTWRREREGCDTSICSDNSKNSECLKLHLLKQTSSWHWDITLSRMIFQIKSKHLG